MPGVVIDQTGPVSYRVQVQGKETKKHADQMRQGPPAKQVSVQEQKRDETPDVEAASTQEELTEVVATESESESPQVYESREEHSGSSAVDETSRKITRSGRVVKPPSWMEDYLVK